MSTKLLEVVKSRPILFKTGMVKAILLGQKTQTRRPITLPDFSRMVDITQNKIVPNWYGYFDVKLNNKVFMPEKHLIAYCAYGKVGDQLWVRETFNNDVVKAYKADFTTEEASHLIWKPSIHMPKELSRITLEITDIRIEQLHDITNLDAMKEGFRVRRGGCYPQMVGMDGSETNKDLFLSVFNKLYPELVEVNPNPWLWVIEFKKL